jgi:hypothetical protein
MPQGRRSTWKDLYPLKLQLNVLHVYCKTYDWHHQWRTYHTYLRINTMCITFPQTWRCHICNFQGTKWFIQHYKLTLTYPMNLLEEQSFAEVTRNRKVHYLVHKSTSLSVLCQTNPADLHAPTSYLFKINFNITVPSTPRSPKWYPPSRFYDCSFGHPSHPSYMHRSSQTPWLKSVYARARNAYFWLLSLTEQL